MSNTTLLILIAIGLYAAYSSSASAQQHQLYPGTCVWPNGTYFNANPCPQGSYVVG